MGWLSIAFVGWILAGVSYHYSKDSVLPVWKLFMRGILTAAAFSLFFADGPVVDRELGD